MRNLYSLIIFALLLVSCKKDEPAGDVALSGFSISDLSRPSFTLDEIYTDDSTKTIYLLFSDRMPADSFPLQFTASFDLPSGATSVPATGSPVVLNSIDNRFKIMVTAADGTTADYYIVLRDNQLPDNEFEDWYTATGMDGKPYSEPGKSAETTVWATANYGTSIYGVYGTTPFTIENNTVVKISTIETAIPVAAGTIFTGKFDVNGAISHPTNPRQATRFGIPFSLRPVSFKFKYSYQPGTRYVRATLNDPNNIFGGFTVTEIPGSDKFTAYAVLEKRSSSNVIEVGRAELYSGDVQSELIEVSLPFVYTSNEKPTHISVVFSSSKDGETFTGAVGSTFMVDDVELVY